MPQLIEDDIISIEDCGYMDTIDISVDSPTHLFFANGILTHNSAYDKSNKLGLANMGESMKKVDHADFVGLFQNVDQEAEKTGADRKPPDIGEMLLSIEKNRSGPKNRSVGLRSNFSQFLIEPLRNAELVEMSLDSLEQENPSDWAKIDVDFSEVKSETGIL